MQAKAPHRYEKSWICIRIKYTRKDNEAPEKCFINWISKMIRFKMIFYLANGFLLLIFYCSVLCEWNSLQIRKVRSGKPAKSHVFNQFNSILIVSYEKMPQPKHQLSTVIMGSMLTTSQRTMGTILHVWTRQKEKNAIFFFIFFVIDELRRNKFMNCVVWPIWSYGFWDSKMGPNWKVPKSSQIK